MDVSHRTTTTIQLLILISCSSLIAQAETAESEQVPQNCIDASPYLSPSACDFVDDTEDQDNPFKLFGEICDEVEFGGWLSGGFTANAHGNRSGNGNLLLGYNNVADGPVLNQLWFYAEKSVDTSESEFDWGFRVDYLFGTDANDNQSFAGGDWDYGWNTGRDYGSAIPQLYTDLAYEDFTLRLGYFLTPVGWEFAQSTENQFYSHSYAFYYGEPNTHAGFMATYQCSDSLEVSAGWAMGWDSWFENPLDASIFVGNVSWSISEATTLTWAVTAGDFGNGIARGGFASNSGDIYMNSLALEHTFTDSLSSVLAHDFGTNTGLGAENHQWYSFVHYSTYSLNNQLSVGSRQEFFRDEDGLRVGVNGAGTGNYYEITLGLNWKPQANITIRPEVRWDWFDGQGLPYDSRNGGLSGTQSRQFTGGMDFILTF